MKRFLNTLATVAIAAGISAFPAAAQTTPDPSLTPGSPGSNAPYTQRDADDDFDYGWLGLIGLAGLIGLFRRGDHTHHDDVRPGMGTR